LSFFSLNVLSEESLSEGVGPTGFFSTRVSAASEQLQMSLTEFFAEIFFAQSSDDILDDLLADSRL